MRLLPHSRDPRFSHGDPGWAPYVWLVFLAFFFFQPILDPHTTAKDWVITAVAIVVFLVLYFAIFWLEKPWNCLVAAVMAAMGIGFGHFNQGASVFVIYAAIFLAWTFKNTRQALTALATMIFALVIDGYFFHAPVSFWGTAIIVSLGVGVSNVFFAERARAMDKLRMAHEEIEHLAKVAERERIARDLHDVLGHTLSLIIVKSTLAGKLLDKNGSHVAVTFDPHRAKNEIADIEQVSRQAMAEIRSTLRGYTTYKLSEEIKRATSTLSTAGVNAQSEAAEVQMSPAQESVISLIVREAITNVVRHAHARHCRLRLAANNGNCVLEVEDDGCGGVHVEGNGLRGMRERIEALGGTLTRDTSPGTKLRFEFPLTAASNGNS